MYNWKVKESVWVFLPEVVPYFYNIDGGYSSIQAVIISLEGNLLHFQVYDFVNNYEVSTTTSKEAFEDFISSFFLTLKLLQTCYPWL